eukprot:TRINITY_DN804_c0_g1_i2.p1 TRINITY_DN804_c0_g1~~TRINITY_DN804_c0_g1_i2.p1  ORF type:complete len:510 (-),score=144.76 TRINITY_DN804_c0_g1_i2:96-1625(-)
MAKDRQEALFELINTERLYVADLGILVQTFLVIQTKKLIPEEDAQMLAPDLNEIFQFHISWLKDVEVRFSSSPDKSALQIGDLFVNQVEGIKVYSSYCTNQPTIPSKIEDLRHRFSGFHDFLKSLHKQEEFRDFNLQEFLEKPLQRLKRYPLLLKSVVDSTKDGHSDKKILEGAFESLKSTVERISNTALQVQQRQRVVDIQNSLGGNSLPQELQLVTRKRLFVWEGSGLVYLKKQKHEASIFLFNDLILFVKKVRRGLLSSDFRLEELDRYLLSTVSVAPLSSETSTSYNINEKERDRGVEITVTEGEGTVLVVLLSTKSERDEWLPVVFETLSSLPKPPRSLDPRHKSGSFILSDDPSPTASPRATDRKSISKFFHWRKKSEDLLEEGSAPDEASEERLSSPKKGMGLEAANEELEAQFLKLEEVAAFLGHEAAKLKKIDIDKLVLDKKNKTGLDAQQVVATLLKEYSSGSHDELGLLLNENSALEKEIEQLTSFVKIQNFKKKPST